MIAHSFKDILYNDKFKCPEEYPSSEFKKKLPLFLHHDQEIVVEMFPCCHGTLPSSLQANRDGSER